MVTQGCGPTINAGALEKQYDCLCSILMNLLCVGEPYRFIEEEKKTFCGGITTRHYSKVLVSAITPAYEKCMCVCVSYRILEAE